MKIKIDLENGHGRGASILYGMKANTADESYSETH
jgi:hypothetical protein